MTLIQEMPLADRNVDASAEEMTRFAINRNWTTDQRDPRNAKYLRPLPEDEWLANEMAHACYGAWAEDYERNGRAFDPGQLFAQCVVDSRRMCCDRAYILMCGGEYSDPQIN